MLKWFRTSFLNLYQHYLDNKAWLKPSNSLLN